jgi:hypothetical protein
MAVALANATIHPRLKEAYTIWSDILSQAIQNEDMVKEAWNWYPQMRKFVVRLKGRYGKKYPHMSVFDWCCYVSILSANVSVKQNMDTANALARLGLEEALKRPEGELVSNSGEFLRKAARILHGEKGEDVLKFDGSPKTYNFALDIYYANRTRPQCTIDTHMLQSIGWHKKSMTGLEYILLCSFIVTLALIFGIPPMVAQALIWIWQRGRA